MRSIDLNHVSAPVAPTGGGGPAPARPPLSPAPRRLPFPQNVRNMVMGVSILAAGAALLAAQIMQIMTDPARLAQLERYSTRDPIAGPGPSWMPADTKLALALGLLFIALMALAQCVRLSVHLGYLLRAAPADPKRGARLRRIAFSINRRERLRRPDSARPHSPLRPARRPPFRSSSLPHPPPSRAQAPRSSSRSASASSMPSSLFFSTSSARLRCSSRRSSRWPRFS